MKRLGKPTAEWTGPNGVRCIQTKETGDEIMVPVEDMVKMICGFNTAQIADPVRREAVSRFQREAPLLQPAAAHRKAVELLKSFGVVTPPELERLPLKKLDGGK